MPKFGCTAQAGLELGIFLPSKVLGSCATMLVTADLGRVIRLLLEQAKPLTDYLFDLLFGHVPVSPPPSKKNLECVSSIGKYSIVPNMIKCLFGAVHFTMLQKQDLWRSCFRVS